jgi:glycerophosphoryl diester phosphodiesterase
MLASDSKSAVPAWLTATPIAHRGLHTLPHTPENSLAAFRAAADAGYPAEMDVRLLADGAVAVFHDGTLTRMTGVDGPLADRTADDLGALRLLGTNEPIPLLTDLLHDIAGRTPLLIEVKSDAADHVGPLEDALLSLLEGYTGPFALQSFRVETVAYLKQKAPALTVGQLASNDTWAERAGIQPDAPPADFLAYNISALPTPITTRLREQRGLPLLAWTVRNAEQQAKAEAEADNFIFDDVRPTG